MGSDAKALGPMARPVKRAIFVGHEETNKLYEDGFPINLPSICKYSVQVDLTINTSKCFERVFYLSSGLVAYLNRHSSTLE